MKPHRRKPTPPGNQPPSGQNGEEEVLNPGYAEAEAADPVHPPYDPGVTYDPGAAFVDENLQYGAPDTEYTDPTQAYYDPGQVYADPGAAYVDPGQAYYDPGQAYADPGAAYVEPGQAYYPEPSETPNPGGVYDEAPAPAPVRSASSPSRPQKKKVARRVPKPSPKLPSGGAAGSKYRRPSYSGGGISMMSVLIALIAMGMLAGVVMIILPGDTSKIAGYPASSTPIPNPRNLLDEVQKIMIERKSAVTFTEAEVNEYLNRRLQGSQKGALAPLLKFKGVYVDFSPGVAEIFIVREIFGKTVTMSSKVVTDRGRKGVVYRPVGWSLGRVDLGVRSIKPVVQLFIRLRSSCLEEFQTLQQMSDVRFEEGQVVLDSVI